MSELSGKCSMGVNPRRISQDPNRIFKSGIHFLMPFRKERFTELPRNVKANITGTIPRPNAAINIIDEIILPVLIAVESAR